MGLNSPSLPSPVPGLLQTAGGKAAAPTGPVGPGHRLSLPDGDACATSPSLVLGMAEVEAWVPNLRSRGCS